MNEHHELWNTETTISPCCLVFHRAAVILVPSHFQSTGAPIGLTGRSLSGGPAAVVEVNGGLDVCWVGWAVGRWRLWRLRRGLVVELVEVDPDEEDDDLGRGRLVRLEPSDCSGAHS